MRAVLIAFAMTVTALPALAAGKTKPPVDESPKTICNEDWIIKASSSRGQLFTLTDSTRIKFAIKGVHDTKKGVTIRVVPAKVWKEFVAGKATHRALEDFGASVTDALTRVYVKDAGEWALVVENTENMMKPATVHVELIINPNENSDDAP